MEPDWNAGGEGNYELDPVTGVRGAGTRARLTASSADERRRVGQSAVTPDKRWHYRYLAAELAWQAAGLLPNESDETARLLCEAGSWLKARDPRAANRFYKALVQRCGTTDLGREAQRLHWLPPLTPESDRAVP